MKFLCHVHTVQRLAPGIYQVILAPHYPLDFKAGQYLKLTLAGKDRYFSIASCPSQPGLIELHIGASKTDEGVLSAIAALHEFKEAELSLEIEGPLGDAWLRKESTNPILLIAGGTGISYIMSLLRNALHHKLKQNIYLYWGVKGINQLYLQQELLMLSEQYPNLHYVFSLEEPNEPIICREGLVIDAILNDFSNLHDFDIYLCGPINMIKEGKTRLLEKCSATSGNMYGDGLTYV
ncbi:MULTISPECIES: flavin mononucleotide reductase LuxG [Vibrio]|uniref:flavin mononucleotide reductase LuxG n=1 Tax=Vibrio TaxID=662 RepID=UPI000893043C|nr:MULTISPECIES: NAD(P)H-flavin reductase [Vibrio]EGR1449599.1 NAD(P)H-flavin reductase [Vibrio cholerae]EJL6589972.1 NAD(P)H-flavin reductase [Vibrio cholerae]EKF9631613.1 NAD(P)H-flavin reductase [Vibrio cholerae]EKF9820883.1 NAD(P)H-flavin reductase [Vibrio cholerae]MCD1192559.1 NAD(P)H-flavin reductase [Vibrio cholerae]